VKRRGLIAGLVAAACAALFGVVPLPALAAGHPRTQEVVARYSYDGAGDAVMVAGGTIRMAPGAILVFAQAEVSSRTNPLVFFPQVVDLDSRDGVRSYGAPGQHTLCAAPLSCSVQGDVFSFGVSNSVEGDGKTPLHLRFYLAARGAKVTLHDRAAIGWKIRHRTSGLVRRTDADATGAGIDAENFDLGVTTSVGAPGPAGGSVAIAVPGCDLVGAGLLMLSGGEQSTNALCPSGPVGELAWHKTTWSASGATAGVSTNQTRLVVLPL